MSNLKIRVGKLESALCPNPEDGHILYFIVDVGGIEPIGYRCGEAEIIRQPDESENEFKKRCDEAVVWPEGNSSQVFYPVYGEPQSDNVN